MERLRLVAIGCGGHASRMIHPSLVRVEEIDWVAACDLQEERVQRTASIYNVTPYTDMQEMIEKEKPAAALVIGPPAMHHEVGLRVLRAGLHVVLEKPPAPTAEGAKELVEAAEAAGRSGAVSTHWRHSPAHRKMREIIESPDFGDPTFFEGRFHAPGPTGPADFSSVFEAYLFYQGVHLVDCTRALMGDIAEVRASGHEGANGAIGLSVSLRFANGAVGMLAMASGTPVMEHYMDVISDGRQRVRVIDHDRLEYQGMPPWTGEGGYADGPTQVWLPGSAAYAHHPRVAYVEEHRHFAQALLAGEEPRASLQDGYEALRVLEAIGESLATDKPVAL